jgi:hypothetical protein
MRARATSIPAKHRGRQSHFGLLAAAGGILVATLTAITYLLWPTWQAGALSGPKQLPITVGGMLFNVPSDAIRMRLQRRSGAQDRIDLAFAYPALTPPEPQKHVRADTVEETQIVVDRLLLSIAVRGDELSPDDRIRTIYPRYLDPRSQVRDGLTGQSFLDASPYHGEDLFIAGSPPFAARCTRDDLTPGICLSQRRIDTIDMTFRFPRAWLSDWRDIAEAMDRLVVRLRGHAS